MNTSLSKGVFAVILVCLTGCGLAVCGQTTVSTPPMGYVKINIYKRTDNLIHLPVLQEPVVIGQVLAFTANTISLGKVKLVVNATATGLDTTLGSMAWSVGQFTLSGSLQQSYYAEIMTGSLKGLCYPISDNTVDTLTLNTKGDNLTAHPLGSLTSSDYVRIRPCWSIGTAFGDSDSTVALNSFSTLPSADLVDSGDSLGLFDPNEIGLDKNPTSRYVYVHSVGWRSLSGSASNQKNVPIPPLTPILVRSHDAEDQQITLVGDAFQSAAVQVVPGGDGSHANDALLAIASSEPVTLNATGLYDPGLTDLSQNVVKASPLATQREDLFMIFDPTRKGFQRPPERSFFYLAGQGWRESGSSSTTIGSSLQLDPTRIYLLRKRPASPSRYWLENEVP